MAELFHVTGPCSIQFGVSPIAAGSVETWTTVGRCSDDDQASFDEERLVRRLTANDTGAEPAELVYQGSVGLLTATLTKWDQVELDKLRMAPGETTIGNAGVVGSTYVGTSTADSECFSVRINPDLTDSRVGYDFYRCYLEGPGSVRDLDFGNDGVKVALQIVVMRDRDGKLYRRFTTS